MAEENPRHVSDGEALSASDLLERSGLTSEEDIEKWRVATKKYDLAVALVRLRERAEMSRRLLAEVVGWTVDEVDSLESIVSPVGLLHSGEIDLGMVQRYVAACGSSLAIAIGNLEERDAELKLHVSEAVLIFADDADKMAGPNEVVDLYSTHQIRILDEREDVFGSIAMR